MRNAYLDLLLKGGMNWDPSLYLSIYDGIRDPEAVRILAEGMQERDRLVLGIKPKIYFSHETESERSAFQTEGEGIRVKTNPTPYNPKIKQHNWR